MRWKTLFILLPLLMLLLLLPFTEYGQNILLLLTEPANREDFLNNMSTVTSETKPTPKTETSSAFKAPEFVGEYTLVSVTGEGDDIRDEDLALIRRLGIPLSLVIREDGSAQLDIFDHSEKPIWAGHSLFEPDGNSQYRFHYKNGRLALRQGEISLLFEKTS